MVQSSSVSTFVDKW